MTTNLQNTVTATNARTLTVEGGDLHTVRPEPASGTELTSRLVEDRRQNSTEDGIQTKVRRRSQK
jgi:hypothetical protein